MFSHELIAQYGVLVVFLSVLGSSLGLPVPAMPTLVTVGASITIATSTRLAAVSHFASMLGAAAAGGLLGDMVWYQGGKRFGERKLRRVCSLALSRDKCLTKTERFFGQWGVRVLIVARFVPGLSLVAVPLCGAMAVRLRYFVAYDCAGVILWASVALAVGGAFAAQIELIFMVISHLGWRALAVVASALAVYVCYRCCRRLMLSKALETARIDAVRLHRLLANEPRQIIVDIRSPERRMLDPFMIRGAVFADEREFTEIASVRREVDIRHLLLVRGRGVRRVDGRPVATRSNQTCVAAKRRHRRMARCRFHCCPSQASHRRLSCALNIGRVVGIHDGILIGRVTARARGRFGHPFPAWKLEPIQCTLHKDRSMDNTSVFDKLRPRLQGIAYRMLGSVAEAEDVVQDAWLRWNSTTRETIENAEAWLVAVTTRISIDRLRAAKIQREHYTGIWLPEPHFADFPATPEQAKERADDVSVAFLMLLERLSPEARAAFLLREVFDADYDEVAKAIGKSEAACRQLVSRAKAQLRDDRPRYVVSRETHHRLLQSFAQALERGDFAMINSMLAEDAVLMGDGGGRVQTFPEPMVGGRRIAQLFYAAALRYKGGLHVELAVLNGQWALLRFIEGALESAQTYETDGERIVRIQVQRNPDKLARIAAGFGGQ
jgi:RNA polymerase sigma-70 factor (ECF subfamily)